MTNAISIPIVVDVARFTKNRVDKRFHERFMANMRRASTLASRAWIAAGKPTMNKVRLDLSVYRSTGKLLDECNIWWGMAGFVDGFCGRRPNGKTFERGLIVRDDSPEFYQQGMIREQRSDVPEGEERVIFHFSEIGDSDHADNPEADLFGG